MPNVSRPNLSLPAGTMLFEYRLERMLGKGGFGLTYLASDVDLGRQVAIKELLPDGVAMRGEGTTVIAQTQELEETFQWASERFLEEARTLAKLTHPNVVKVIRYLKANQTVYMVMDFVQGQSLEQIVKANGGPLPEAQVRGAFDSLLGGVEYIHRQDVLHRDIKPGNILITPDGTPVLIDFGSARQNIGRTVAMTAVVSFGYSPWEQIMTNGRQGPWTDIHALAGTVIYLMTGKTPVSAADRISAPEGDGWLVQQLGHHYSEAFLRGIEWGFRVHAKDRPQSVAEWRAYFAQIPGVAPVEAIHALPSASTLSQPPASTWSGFDKQPASTPPSALSTPVPAVRFWLRHKFELAGGAVGVLALIIAAVLFWPESRTSGDSGNNSMEASSSSSTPTTSHSGDVAFVPTPQPAPIPAPVHVPTPTPVPAPVTQPQVQTPPAPQGKTAAEMEAEDVQRQKQVDALALKHFQQGLAYYNTDESQLANKDEKAFGEFQEAADAGNPTANGYLAYFYLKGRGGRSDPNRAEDLAQKNPDDAFSQYVLGSIRYHSNRKDEALGYFQKSAAAGSMEGEAALAHLLMEKGDIPNAATWAQKAADQGDTAAEFDLFNIYNSAGALHDDDKAQANLRLAAAKGNPGYEKALGEWLKARNQTEADSWFSKARSGFETEADHGSGHAQFECGIMLKTGEGSATSPANDRLAMNYFKQAETSLLAEEPSATQQYSLGQIYALGLNGTADSAKAKACYQQAADMGSAAAALVLKRDFQQ